MMKQVAVIIVSFAVIAGVIAWSWYDGTIALVCKLLKRHRDLGKDGHE